MSIDAHSSSLIFSGEGLGPFMSLLRRQEMKTADERTTDSGEG